MYLAKQLTSNSLPYIAERFRRSDHSTVLHAVHRIMAYLEEGDERTVQAIAAIQRILNHEG